MLIVIKADMEIYDNTGEYLVQVDTKEFQTVKMFVNSIDKVEPRVEAHIEKLLNCTFNSSCAEASPDLYSSMIYHYTTKELHYQLFIRVESNTKKVVFKDYYPAIAYNFPLNSTEISA